MKIIEWEGLHYCQGCGDLVIDEDHDSVEYCDKCAAKRGWNFIDRRRVKVPKEGECCDNEDRDINGGCKNCGDPCY